MTYEYLSYKLLVITIFKYFTNRMNIVEKLGTKTKGLLNTYILYIFVQLCHILIFHQLLCINLKANITISANCEKSIINLRKD